MIDLLCIIVHVCIVLQSLKMMQRWKLVWHLKWNDSHYGHYFLVVLSDELPTGSCVCSCNCIFVRMHNCIIVVVNLVLKSINLQPWCLVSSSWFSVSLQADSLGSLSFTYQHKKVLLVSHLFIPFIGPPTFTTVSVWPSCQWAEVASLHSAESRSHESKERRRGRPSPLSSSSIR